MRVAPETARSPHSFGFLHFSNRVLARKALFALHGKNIAGSDNVRCDFLPSLHSPSWNLAFSRESSDPERYCRVFHLNAGVTDEALFEYFDRLCYGKIRHARVPSAFFFHTRQIFRNRSDFFGYVVVADEYTQKLLASLLKVFLLSYQLTSCVRTSSRPAMSVRW